jgi:CHAT domain
MPIPREELYTTVLAVAPNATVGQVLQQLPQDRNHRVWTYVVAPLADGRYLAFLWKDVEQIARNMGGDIKMIPIATLDGLPQPIAAVEQDSMGLQAARDLQAAQPGKCLVVVSGGQVVGLLYEVTRAGEALGDDPFAVSKGLDNGGPMVLSGEEAPAVEPQPASEPQPDDRVINAWVSDAEEQKIPPEQPLEIGNTYNLKFNADRPMAGSLIRSDIIIASIWPGVPADQETIDITISIDTDDFTVNGSTEQTITVPRTGRSKNNATFNIEPKHNGPGVIRAFFFFNNRLFQKRTLTIQVGSKQPETLAMNMQSSGMTMGSMMNQQWRRNESRVSLMISETEKGYSFLLQYSGAVRAAIILKEEQIAQWVNDIRKMFKEIVFTQAGGQNIYQLENTTIPADVHAATLKTMAKMGMRVYNQIFYGPLAGDDAHAMGNLLRQLSQQRKLHIDVVAEAFTFPWSLLYDRGDLKIDGSNVDPEGFWGLKHVIEYTPQFGVATLSNFVPEITVTDKLALSFVCNTTIDTQMKRPIIAGQRAFLQGLSGISMTEHPTTTDLCDLLNNPDSPTQVMYFYCHAVSYVPGDAQGSVGDSKVVLSDQAITLNDLNTFAGLDRPALKSAPLVFMNCCQSAELTPYLYDGLVPYLIAKGARGVIGTEVDTPALFAAEFAKEFLTRFIKGEQNLGDILLDLRRKYLLEKNNVMGLVYALHSSGEVCVVRGG